MNVDRSKSSKFSMKTIKLLSWDWWNSDLHDGRLKKKTWSGSVQSDYILSQEISSWLNKFLCFLSAAPASVTAVIPRFLSFPSTDGHIFYQYLNIWDCRVAKCLQLHQISSEFSLDSDIILPESGFEHTHSHRWWLPCWTCFTLTLGDKHMQETIKENRCGHFCLSTQRSDGQVWRIWRRRR